MTTLAIRSDSASSIESRQTSPTPRTLTVFGTDGSVRLLNHPDVPVRAENLERCQVFVVEFEQPGVVARTAYSAFDALLTELESSKETASQLQEGRKWVSGNFYNDLPTLASLRLAAGLSQKQLADACGMEQPHISRYESGKHDPSLRTSRGIAKALGVNLEVFCEALDNTQHGVDHGAR